MLRATFLLILPLMVLCGTVFAQGSMEVTTTVPATGSNLTVEIDGGSTTGTIDITAVVFEDGKSVPSSCYVIVTNNSPKVKVRFFEECEGESLRGKVVKIRGGTTKKGQHANGEGGDIDDDDITWDDE